MDITKNNTDELNAVVTVKIDKEDYEEKVNTTLKDYRKKVSLNGFRPGKVPFGLIKKTYGTQVLIEEINKILQESLYKYLVDEDIPLIGEPLAKTDEESNNIFEIGEPFEFNFDIALRPNFELILNKKTKIPYYQINVDEKLINDQIENYKKTYGKQVPVEISTEKSFLKGELIQIDEQGKEIENGIKVESASIYIDVIGDDEIKKEFVDKKAEDVIAFDVKKAFTNEIDLAALLEVDKEELAELSPDFKYTIKEILDFEEAELTQEIFDKIYGEGEVTSIDEAKEKIKKDYKEHFEKEQDYKFLIDARDKLVNKTEMTLPEDFLKRWILSNKENKLSPEQLDEQFPDFAVDMKWQLIKDKIVKENELKASEDEMLQASIEVMKMEFARYGLPLNSIPEEQLNNFAKERLAKKEEEQKIRDKVFEDKIAEILKEKLKLDEKEISHEEFLKLFE